MRSVAYALIALAPLVLAACASNSTQTADAPPTGAAATSLSDTTPIAADSTVMLVRGLSCPKCANNIHVSLTEVPGVADSRIDLESGRVTILFDPLAKSHPSPATLAKVVRDAGFTPVELQ